MAAKSARRGGQDGRNRSHAGPRPSRPGPALANASTCSTRPDEYAASTDSHHEGGTKQSASRARRTPGCIESRGAAPSVTSVTLTQDLEDVLDRRPGVFGVYARNLTTGDTVVVSDDRIFPAESSVKTAILLHYERCVDASVLDPRRRVGLGPSDGSTAQACCATSPTAWNRRSMTLPGS